MKKILIALFAVGAIVLAACGSVYEKEPVGIGPDHAELKKSPCACLEVELLPDLPEWYS